MCSDYKSATKRMFAWFYSSVVFISLASLLIALNRQMIDTSFYQCLTILGALIGFTGYSVALYANKKINYALEAKACSAMSTLILIDIIFKVTCFLTGQITFAEAIGNFGFVLVAGVITTIHALDLKDRMLYLIRRENERIS